MSSKKRVQPPQIISFAVTERCNARCTTCDLWKPCEKEELSARECLSLLSQLRAWSPYSVINFTGGEPFVRSDFSEILTRANNLGFYTTAITNGIVFDAKHIDSILATGVNYLNFSINSIDPDIHDSYKGIKGLHARIVEATKYIRSRNNRVRICYSPVITRDNYKTLNDFVLWARETGADIVDFIPILSSFGHNVRVVGPAFAWAQDPLFKIEDLKELDRQIDLLIHKKKIGFPIVTPIYYLEKMKLYYRDPASVPPRKHCYIGLKNMYILSNGDVKLCYYFPAIGNVRAQSLKEIWFGKTAQAQRQELFRCSRPCICSALREYALRDKISIFLMRARLL
ncbi:MAG: radical SAM protein [Candidatus Omnitrophica bacterium]|nr:radical SAM protein [Candidatus Omnitrophota bacterium]